MVKGMALSLLLLTTVAYAQPEVDVGMCIAKGKWGRSVADEAKDKINTIEYHLYHLGKKTNGRRLTDEVLADGERVIREAYESGYKDPVKFGKTVILNCLAKGY